MLYQLKLFLIYSYLKLAKENRNIEKNESIKICYFGLMYIINL